MLAWRTRFMYSVSRSITSLGVGTGGLHRGHARRVLGRGRFEQRAKNLHLHVARQQAPQQSPPASARKYNRPARPISEPRSAAAALQVSFDGHHALELVHEQIHRVDFAFREHGRSPNSRSVRRLQNARCGKCRCARPRIAARACGNSRALSCPINSKVNSLRAMLVDKTLRQTNQVRVEPAG